MKNVACTGYICSRMELTESRFSIHALMKNVARTGYIYIIEWIFKILWLFSTHLTRPRITTLLHMPNVVLDRPKLKF